MSPLHPLLLVLVLLLPPPFTLSLSPTAHCTTETPPHHCRCSLSLTHPPFCLSHTPTHCIQHPCPPSYVCDCAGDTFCRLSPIRSTPLCLRHVSALGTCPCHRSKFPSAPNQAPLYLVLPLRSFHSSLQPPNRPFCTERPHFWSQQGEDLLIDLWTHLSDSFPNQQEGTPTTSLHVIQLGHPGHAVTFTTPQALSHALTIDITSHPSHAPSAIEGELIDPHLSPANPVITECIATLLAIRLATKGVATRPGIEVAPYNAGKKWILQPCALLRADNPVVGMTVERLLERVTWGTGEWPQDDGGVGHADLLDGCRAVNRNFELCQVDLGCIVLVG
eukprot:GFKZ01001696.1.p1 GENE.GFKZ01001696.1~~GFKZ01001696.1.p1  ORF type:complete len:333 (-),score=23.96 GFKZ01001696.1:414-1412(-)